MAHPAVPDASRDAFILVERLRAAGDPTDRRQALEEMVKLARDHPAEVGQHGMLVLSDMLQCGLADANLGQVRERKREILISWRLRLRGGHVY
jgi:hypothetical protein